MVLVLALGAVSDGVLAVVALVALGVPFRQTVRTFGRTRGAGDAVVVRTRLADLGCRVEHVRRSTGTALIGVLAVLATAKSTGAGLAGDSFNVKLGVAVGAVSHVLGTDVTVEILARLALLGG